MFYKKNMHVSKILIIFAEWSIRIKKVIHNIFTYKTNK